MDRGIDDFIDPCNPELWDVMERDDHWDHWDDDNHHDDREADLWSILMSSSVDSVSFAFLSCYES